ncbi:hypothetical protein P152DRAFT_400729 [Eremomyces bilateralis CBS 781.70]|uniref:D-serine dehydratase-like domain-containing protein n=1 Tax=Eremomyces bilateralis CBS 781.70 TaxID=1392243 RepID=A0A6G1FXE0_9PEZI|nr:uncharacterized protein P152DRAFT_400729 [Eremomyces bilateralis CBS 781.70]KAF1810565.1 hypothetical protein P152DRAFT_400729 [Eremomyces bilateralis CBS 781.70]
MSASSLLYPMPSVVALKSQFVGRHLRDVDAPAAVLDRAVVIRNCERMRTAASGAGVRFRGHVKTHKTVEVTQLQVGDSKEVRLIVSTIAELELLTPWLLDCKRQGKTIDVLYGVPVSKSALPRLIHFAQLLERELPIKIIIDTVSQFTMIKDYLLSHYPPQLLSSQRPPFQVGVYIKIDTGYGRAGIPPQSNECDTLLQYLAANEEPADCYSRFVLEGLYSHLGSSYGATGPKEAMSGFKQELTGLVDVLSVVKKSYTQAPDKALVLSVGASPTALALASELPDGSWDHSASSTVRAMLEDVMGDSEAPKHIVEVHAGVYTTLDMQQLATKSFGTMRTEDIAIRILAEVASVYTGRERPEALIAAGNLALGREPCREYSGWGVVTGWRSEGDTPGEGNGVNSSVYDFEGKTGWVVGRISQEHGILVWEGDRSQQRELRAGEKVLILPNHSCIAGAGYGWYLVVDSSRSGEERDVVQDVWVRCRGW